MNEAQVITALAALAQETRLRVFRLLVRAGHVGLVVSEIAEGVVAAPATLSFHLKALAQAGLIEARNEGRFIRYSACYDTTTLLLRYLTENCCGGRDCQALIDCVDPEQGCTNPRSETA